jgi:hypothetical protein
MFLKENDIFAFNIGNLLKYVEYLFENYKLNQVQKGGYCKMSLHRFFS